MSDECRYPKCDVCGADAKADATPRTEVGETVKRWVVRQTLLPGFDKYPGGSGWERVVLASDYDAEVKAHEMTAHELKCAEGSAVKAEAVAAAADAHALACRNEVEVVRAERDRLQAVVERVRALREGWITGGPMLWNRTHWTAQAVESIDRALAEPVEATFPRCRECGKWKQP